MALELRDVAVLHWDGRLARRLVELLRRAGLAASVPMPGEAVCARLCIVDSTPLPRSASCERVVRSTGDALVDAIVVASTLLGAEEVVLGVDPSPNLSAYAVIVAGSVVATGYATASELADLAGRLASTGLGVRIRLGAGAGAEELLELLLSSQATLELIDEHGTSGSKPYGVGAEYARSGDEEAAISIAFRRGIVVTAEGGSDEADGRTE